MYIIAAVFIEMSINIIVYPSNGILYNHTND